MKLILRKLVSDRFSFQNHIWTIDYFIVCREGRGLVGGGDLRSSPVSGQWALRSSPVSGQGVLSVVSGP